ncbi:MAG: glycogen/starch/alpha-glucan family phosphorylase [Chitinispirillaceae bacterium]|nr:glycogen/starch/alpha-glucan family phosphorylase [Chitinispirillaceae bacterium]
MQSKDFRGTYYRYLRYFLAKDETTATSYDKYMALAYAVRSELTDHWIETQKRYFNRNVRRVYILSMEYIFGKSLRNNIINLGIQEPIEKAVPSLGFSLDDVYQQEDNCELGNSGKGRMAVCYLDSMATLGIPAMGYGLRYDYAQFQQDIQNGVQSERPYDWLHRGHPWEIIRPEYSCAVNFSGECIPVEAGKSMGPHRWSAGEQVYAVPYDVPIVGYRNRVVNTLRLWSARASEEFLPDYANHQDYVRACEEKSQLGRITKVLFPQEDVRRSTDLRMKQQYFFICATLQDITRRYKVNNADFLEFDKRVTIHLNGSRCALAIPELMRILIDVEKVPWDRAWQITSNVFSYTSHAMSQDHIESWPVYKVAQLLPRHMQILFDINQIHLDTIRSTFSSDPDVIRELSLIEEGEVKRIRLANLAALGSFSVNGVSRVQTESLCKKLFPVHTRFFAHKFRNITAGAAHRRWLLCANPGLASLISETIGTSWTTDARHLERLEQSINNRSFLHKLTDIKLDAKRRLGRHIEAVSGCRVDELALFDIQIGMVHPSKRLVLHLFHILNDYLRLRAGGTVGTPRVHLFAGKASPSDVLAKQIIHLINIVAAIVNNDAEISRYIKVVFLPNMEMSEAERIIPAADLSEQLSTPNFVASGTFNMKFAFNGALTIASRGGTNVELVERLGEEAIYPFGKSLDELETLHVYKPYELTEADLRLKAIFTFFDEVLPSVPGGSAVYPLLASLRDSDRFFVILDFDDYIRQQERVAAAYIDQWTWSQHSLQAIARSGLFTSDRTVLDYAHDIWKVSPQ